jgi:hypothetical protein
LTKSKYPFEGDEPSLHCAFCNSKLEYVDYGLAGGSKSVVEKFECTVCTTNIHSILEETFLSKFSIYYNIIDNKIENEHIIFGDISLYTIHNKNETYIMQYIPLDKNGSLWYYGGRTIMWVNEIVDYKDLNILGYIKTLQVFSQ